MKNVHRPNPLKKYRQTVLQAASLGFKIVSYQILGLPGEKLSSMVKTLRFNAKLPVLLGASPFYLIPGSPIACGFAPPSESEILKARLTAMATLTKDFSREDLYTLFITTRILNFLKGLPIQISSIPLRKALFVASKLDKRTAVGAKIFQRLLQNKKFYASTPQLRQRAGNLGVPCWIFEHKGQPRAAVGFSFGLLLALMVRLGLVSDPTEEVEDAIKLMRDLKKRLTADVPVNQNPAKRIAGQMLGRDVTIFGAGHMFPVARRWKTQINELAKAQAAFESLPEADHNTLAGSCNPEKVLAQTFKLFIQSDSDHPRNVLRSNLTRQSFMQEGINTDFYKASGASRIAQLWSAIQFGDYAAYYLALAYDIDPTAIPPITELKQKMTH